MSVVTVASAASSTGAAGASSRAAVVAQVDPARLQLLVEAAEIGLLELERLGELVDLGEVEAAALLAPVDQSGDRSARRVAGHCHHCE